MERVAVEAERAERKAMAARHLAIGLAGQEKLAKALADLTDADAYDMVVKKPGEAWRLLEGAVRLERESRGVTPAERDESGQGTAGVQLARAYLMHDEARQKMLESFDLLMAATVDGRRPVLDAWTGEPLD